MARKFVLVDDIDGAEDDVQTVTFTIDGRSFEIELATKNRTKFNAQQEYWISHARSTGKRKTSSTPSVKTKATGSGLSSDEMKAIREWARKQGMQISDRGRIHADIRKAYEEAHAGSELFSA